MGRATVTLLQSTLDSTPLDKMKMRVLVANLLLVVAVQGQMPDKMCKGECQASGSICEGKVVPGGCSDVEQCCMTGKKPDKKCKGECQASGSICEGKVIPGGCSDVEQCCMTGKKPGKKCKGECQ